MLSSAWLRGKPRQFQRLTGLSVEKFDALVEKFTPLWEAAERKRRTRPNRQRALGGGHPYALRTVEDKLLCALVFLRIYPTYEVLGLFVGMHLSNVDRLLRRALPVLQEATGKTLQLPRPRRGQKRVRSLEEFFTRFPDLRDVIVDATEQPTRRPKNNTEQRRHFSGKRKRHTLKTQLLVSVGTGAILSVSHTVPGSVHDKTLLAESRALEHLADGTTVRGDLGYLGVAPNHPRLDIRLPARKGRGKPRRPADVRRNRVLARQRIGVEHVIRRCKIFRVLGETYRQARERYNLLFQIVAGLVNLRLAAA